MRLKRVSLRGLTMFRQLAAVDFAALGPGLVAVVGRNGAGKSSLLEAVPAALYKRMPSRSGIYEHFNGRDAFVEVAFDDAGHEILVRMLVDAEQRTAERYATVDGEAQTQGRSAEVDAFVEKRFGSEALFLASAFAAQTKAGSFLVLPKAERKGLFVELLGLGHLQRMAEAARERKAGSDRAAAMARTVLAKLETEISALPEIRLRAEAAQAEQELLASDLRVASKHEDQARTQLAEARASDQAYGALVQAEAAAQRELRAREQALREAEQLAPQAREAAERRRRALTNPLTLVAQANARHSTAIAQIAQRRREYEHRLEGEPKAIEGAEALPALEALEENRRRAEEHAAQARAKKTLADQQLQAARRAVTSGQQQLDRDRERLTRQSSMLSAVPCGTDLQGRCPLLADAVTAAGQLACLAVPPEVIDDAVSTEHAALAAGSALQAAEKALHDIMKTAPPGGWTLALARSAVGDLRAIETIKRELANLAGEGERADGRLAAELAEADAEAQRVAKERDAIDADLTDAILEADARARAAHLAFVEAKGQALEAAAALGAAAAVSVEESTRTLAVATAARTKAERTLQEAGKTLAKLSAQVESLEAKAAEAMTARGAVVEADIELGDWTLLERALGRDGIQALEIDAAGPEVAEITNELLAACYGARFSLRLETLREKKTKAGEYSEAFDVRVFDRGIERQVEALSGGEKVVVGEALGLAIAIFQARRSGSKIETIFRDETAGALDPDNGEAYIQMLKKARLVGGFHQLIFVAHQTDLVAMADVRVHVRDGEVTTE